MKPSIEQKLQGLVEHYEAVSTLLSSPEVINDQNRFRELSKEFAQLEPVVKGFQAYCAAGNDLRAAEALLKDEDPDMREMAAEELKEAKARQATLEEELQKLLLPVDPLDEADVYLEIRAGAGGDEAAIFAGDLFRMYSYFAESQRWQIEIANANGGEHGGYKEVIAKVTGKSVYAQLKFESGAHRVQRVPDTETQGRVHTSAVTVAVLPIPDEIEAVEINPSDLRTDTFRASGAGGQHINKTDSAIRITHLPTGTVVECQEERSQHKNRARAMSLLQAKLLQEQQRKQDAEMASTRRNLVGSGDRSERIRTYNFPQGRVTDHRINLTLYKLNDILAGQLSQLIEPLRNEHQADLLAAATEEPA